MLSEESQRKVNSSVLVAAANITAHLILSKLCRSKSIMLSKPKLLRLKRTFRFSAKTTPMFMLSATAANIELFFAKTAHMKNTQITSTSVAKSTKRASKAFSSTISPK